MIMIEKKDLKNLLESKKQSIEHPHFTGIGDIVSGISLFVTLCTSNFHNIPIVRSPYFSFLMYIFSIVITIIGVYSLISSIRSRQTIKNLYDSIHELDIKRTHVVNIVLLRSAPNKGKFLLVKNRSWKCELFPSYNSCLGKYDVVTESERLKKFILRDVGFNVVSLEYINSMKEHIKNCAGKNLPYRYVFHFYHAEITINDKKYARGFSYNGKKYVWKSLEQMFKNKNIMKKNADVIEYVANLESIPYN